MDRQRFKGAYVGKGYNLTTLAKAMGISQPTLITRLREGTLTLRDIERLREVLDLDDGDIMTIFFPRA